MVDNDSSPHQLAHVHNVNAMVTSVTKELVWEKWALFYKERVIEIPLPSSVH